MQWRIKAPATSANLGAGFDTLALALSLHNELVCWPSERFTLTIEGVGEDALPRDRTNAIVQSYERTLAALGIAETRPLHFHAINRIPVGRGLGSSASALCLGALAAFTQAKRALDRHAALEILAPLEGHADNLAACLFGGLSVAWTDRNGKARARSVPGDPAKAPRLVAVVPSSPVPTRLARRCLPKTLPFEDAVHNLQRSALVLTAWACGEAALWADALSDRLHEPYRAHLYPGLEALRRHALEQGALGTCMSGAGPTLLVFLPTDLDLARLSENLRACAEANGLEIDQIRALEIERSGAMLTR